MRQNFIPNLTGKTFGKLRVIKRTENINYKYASWLCRCECGKEITTRGTSLRSGNSKSCGCARARSQRNKFNPFTTTYTLLKRLDESKNRETMTYEEFLEFPRCKSCCYCGEELKWNAHGSARKINLDRIDSSLGHTKSNCVPCCRVCNRMKSDFTQNEFISHCKQIVNHAEKDTTSLSGVK
jgi:hypothetical protein